MLIIEKQINFIVGIFLLSNLYFLNNLIGVSREVLIISLLVISFIFFLKNYSSKLLTLLGTQLVLIFFLLSFVFFLLNLALKSYEVNANDIVRVIGYMFFFGWTFSLYRHNMKSLRRYLTRLIELLLIIIVLMSIVEYYYYNIFRSFLVGEEIDVVGGVRLAVTYMDPNSFASALAVYLFIHLSINGYSLKGILVVLVISVLINLTGSRLGLLLLVIILFHNIKKINLTFKFVKTGLFFLFVLLGFYLASLGFSSEENEYKSVSAFDRFFNSEFEDKSKASSDERINSLIDGYSSLNLSNFFFPAGGFFFKAKWEREVNARHYPHSSFLYLIVEYGIYAILPIFIFLKLYLRSRISKLKSLYLLLFLQLLLLPNAMYYATIYLIIFFIEINYEYSCNSTFVEK
ncbi:MAG: hypothetical protein ACK4UP_06860 [Spirosomataceae bacterium]